MILFNTISSSGLINFYTYGCLSASSIVNLNFGLNVRLFFKKSIASLYKYS